MTDRPYSHFTLEQLQAIIDDPRIGAPAKRRAAEEKALKLAESTSEKDWAHQVQYGDPDRVRAMRFCMPLPINRVQGGGGRHWTTHYRQDERFRAVCDALAAYGTLPDPPAFPYQRVRVRAKFYVWSEMDEDNLMARVKPAIDWLVKAGYVADDRKENIEWAGIPDQELDRGCPRLVLRISQPKEDGQC